MSGEDLDVLLIAAGCAGAVAAVGLVAVALPGRRSVRAGLFAVALVSVLSVVAGVVGAAEAMFLSGHDLSVVLRVSAVAAVVALGVALLLGRRVVRDVEGVRASARALAAAPGTAARQAGTAAAPAPPAARGARLSELAEIEAELTRSGRRRSRPITVSGRWRPRGASWWRG